MIDVILAQAVWHYLELPSSHFRPSLLMPVATMAGPMLRAVAGARPGLLRVPRSLCRSHCAVAQVLAHLVGELVGHFLDFEDVDVAFFAGSRFSASSASLAGWESLASSSLVSSVSSTGCITSVFWGALLFVAGRCAVPGLLALRGCGFVYFR